MLVKATPLLRRQTEISTPAFDTLRWELKTRGHCFPYRSAYSRGLSCHPSSSVAWQLDRSAFPVQGCSTCKTPTWTPSWGRNVCSQAGGRYRTSFQYGEHSGDSMCTVTGAQRKPQHGREGTDGTGKPSGGNDAWTLENCSGEQGEMNKAKAGICSVQGIVTSWVVLVGESWGMQVRIKREADESQETPKELQLNCVQVSKCYIPDHKGKRTPVQPVFIDIYKVIKHTTGSLLWENVF